MELKIKHAFLVIGLFFTMSILAWIFFDLKWWNVAARNSDGWIICIGIVHVVLALAGLGIYTGISSDEEEEARRNRKQ